MVQIRFTSLVLAAVTFSSALAFPTFEALGGLSKRQAEVEAMGGSQGGNGSPRPKLPPPPPGPPAFTGAKLVDDARHPWRPTRPGDIRGPCPGLNTLASHGVS